MSAILSAGTILKLTISGTPTAITNIVSISGPSMTVTDVDITILMSTGRWKEFLAGFKDGGVISLEANYDKTVYATLFSKLGNSNEVWQLIFSDASSLTFNGHLNALGAENPEDAEAGMPFAIKLTGAPTHTP